MEVGCANADKVWSLSKETLLATPPPREVEAGCGVHSVHVRYLSLERKESALVEEQSYHRDEDCAAGMTSGYEENQIMINMKLYDDLEVKEGQYDIEVVTPSVL